MIKNRLNCKEKLMSFGTYPEVSLSKAREKRLEARKLVADGIDPLEVRADEKQQQREVHENTFEKLAAEWLTKQGTLAASTQKLINSRLERDICPYIGKKPISSITPKQTLDLVIRPMEKRGAIVLSKRVKSAYSSESGPVIPL